MDINEIVNKTNLQHIAIIMDGNRRWAKSRNLPSAAGHKAGVDALKRIVHACGEFSVKYLTVYAFSTENWGRKKEEVDFLMSLLAHTIQNELYELNKANVKINIIGNLSELNPNLQDILNNAMKTTNSNTGLSLQIAINYGARNEIVDAVKNISCLIKESKLNIDDINSELISQHLYTNDVPDPDLVIRAGGESRISNFLLWQIAYSEIYITDSLWPDFDKKVLANAITDFANRNRRFGKD